MSWVGLGVSSHRAPMIFNFFNFFRAESKTGDGKMNEENGYRVTMPFMVTVLCAHLNRRI